MIRIGILGCAEIAFRRFLPALMENKEFECVCIAEEYADIICSTSSMLPPHWFRVRLRT